MVEVKVSGLLNILNVWFRVSKGMFPVRYVHSNKSSRVSQIRWRLLCCHKDEINLATVSFGDTTGFKSVVYVLTFSVMVLIICLILVVIQVLFVSVVFH